MARTSPERLRERERPVTQRRRFRFNRMKFYDQVSGYLFIAPAVIIISIFGLFPIGYAIYMSTHRWTVRQGRFLGIENYTRTLGDWTGAGVFALGFALLLTAYGLWNSIKSPPFAGFAQRFIRKIPSLLLLVAAFYAIGWGWGRMVGAGDARFLNSLIITVYYALGAVPTQIVLGLLLAYILFQNLRGQEFFRMLFFMPYIVPVVAASVVFGRLFSPRETSFMNNIMTTFGLPVQRWLQDPRPASQVLFGLELPGLWAGPSLALVVIIVFGIWNYTGFNVILFLAGLGNIPRELYEAAEIDGANTWQSFVHITVPLLSPITFYLSLIGFIGTLQVFNTVYVMRTPEALGTADTAGVVIFDTFFQRNQYGLATAQAVILFGIILFVTVVQYRILGKRVFNG